MSSNLTQKQIESLKSKCNGLESWLKTDEGHETIRIHRDHEAWLQEKLSQENLKTLSSAEFGDVYKRLWASNNWSTNDWYVKKKLIGPNTIENIRTSLSKLLYSDASIDIRYDEFKVNVTGLGPSSLSEILHFVFPNKYCLWNSKHKEILPNLGLDILPKKFKYQIKTGQEYSECVRVLGSIKDAMKNYGILDFIDLDIMFRYLDLQKVIAGEQNIALTEFMEPPAISTYSIKDIIDEGCFVKEPKLESIMNMLESEKNLILQGPPGTGKTYLAKKLAFALVGHKPDSRVRVVQFHTNLSYEDFVRGWRPSGSDKGGNGLDLMDGPFLKMIKDAKNEPEQKFVMVIEEINRGNPANIFGEMLTLLEADKRKQEEALSLSYMLDGEDLVYIPDNLYVIGTMNVADRSIALVDLALRRRFCFYSLEPVFDKTWEDWVREQCGISDSVLKKIKECMMELNQTIENDELLGPHFKVGHSYVTPNGRINNPQEWFKRIASSKIKPLLDEYWVEGPDKVNDAMGKLLEKFDS